MWYTVWYIKWWCCQTSVAYIGPKSRTERPRKTKTGTKVAHVTRDSDTTFKVKRSKVKVTRPLYSPRRLHIRQLQRWTWESIHRGNLLLHCRLQARQLAQQRQALRHPQRAEGQGHIVAAARLQLVNAWEHEPTFSQNMIIQTDMFYNMSFTSDRQCFIIWIDITNLAMQKYSQYWSYTSNLIHEPVHDNKN